MADLRWILLGFGLLLLVGIWWWGARRSRRLPGDAQLREAAARPTAMGPTAMSAPVAVAGASEESHDWGVPPFEPLNIRTAEFDQVPIADLPMMATTDPLDVSLTMEHVEHVEHEIVTPAFSEEPVTEAEPWREYAEPTYAAADGESAATESGRVEGDYAQPAAPADTAEAQRIVTLRVCAVEDSSWAGSELFAVLEGHGLSYGRYKVFHRRHSDGRSLFCAASLVEPGTFDLARMPQQEFRGLTLFAVLPGPADALYTVDTLIGTAMQLAETLQGTVQDSGGAPLSAERVTAMREDAARIPAASTTP